MSEVQLAMFVAEQLKCRGSLACQQLAVHIREAFGSAEGQHKHAKGRREEDGKGCWQEGASTATERRRECPPGSKNKPRIGQAVMQKTQAQAKA
eukprot:365361-Chlamydomonas_euryale.AAC.11